MFGGGFETTPGTITESTMTMAFNGGVGYNIRAISGNGVSGAYHDYGVAWDTAYHIAEARRTGTADKFQLDSGSEFSGSYPTNVARYIVLHGYNADLVTDWVLVRKYASTEPVATAGSEEVGLGAQVMFIF